MSQYITRCFLILNGQEFDDFKSFEENERELNIQVALMNKTGTAGKTPRHGFTVEYVPPSGPRINWDAVKGATFVCEDEDGTRTSYTGVSTGKVGASKRDGENVMVVPITLLAEDRRVE